MNHDNMTGADLGRTLAPDGITDKASWGRRLLKQIKAMGVSVTEGLKQMGLTRNQSDVHEQAMTRVDRTRDYRAPHAYRGTPPRPHHPRLTPDVSPVRTTRATVCKDSKGRTVLRAHP